MTRKKRTRATGANAYAASDTCSDPTIRAAIKHSTGASGPSTISTVNVVQDREAKKRFDDNYAAIFGHD
jgi:hypothetical protein